MGIIVGKGILIDFCETTVECPICTYTFNASKAMDKAKYPYFRSKCPACKSAIGILVPVFGGTTKVYEWSAPKGHQLNTESPLEIIVLK